ncbi:hypothetical protein [Cellulomonas cellasea]|uniref:Uncharacterized protein n=2 Tax=Cellulomonas cellasea TaxID=43670 RepID=A0A0A0B9S1_9CELL|nr:hypothetical protein [Cellulomonas cellasea]KGM03635.1 hypothetical protein Q760_17690 [Cellulomonas cellasea DSM 20118]GEA87475.1 hypothetical protein CCE01nite_14240 [Cellulomonas cellasea]
MVSRAAGPRARTVLWPLVALLTLLGFAWMHVVAVTDPGTAQHHHVAGVAGAAGETGAGGVAVGRAAVAGAAPVAHAVWSSAADLSGHHAGRAHAAHDTWTATATEPDVGATNATAVGAGPGLGPVTGSPDRAPHRDGDDGGGHAAMVGCLLALTGVAAWVLRRRPSGPGLALAQRQGRPARRDPAATWAVPARGCGPPRIALCVLRV